MQEADAREDTREPERAISRHAATPTNRFVAETWLAVAPVGARAAVKMIEKRRVNTAS